MENSAKKCSTQVVLGCRRNEIIFDDNSAHSKSKKSDIICITATVTQSLTLIISLVAKQWKRNWIRLKLYICDSFTEKNKYYYNEKDMKCPKMVK